MTGAVRNLPIGEAARARLGVTAAVAAVAIAASAVLAIGMWFTVQSWAQVLATGPASLDDVVAAAAAATALGVAAWLAAASTLSALAAARADRPGGGPLGRCARAIAPLLLRRLITALVGAAVAMATAGPALAADPAHPAPRVGVAAFAASGPVTADALDPGWTPPPLDRPTAEAAASTQASPAGWPRAGGGTTPPAATPAGLPGPQPRASLEDEVVVRRGDTLWDIAARHLGPGAEIAEIAVEWPRWYAANRHRIGPDPDHIEPGQRLVPPAAHAGPAAGQR